RGRRSETPISVVGTYFGSVNCSPAVLQVSTRDMPLSIHTPAIASAFFCRPSSEGMVNNSFTWVIILEKVSGGFFIISKLLKQARGEIEKVVRSNSGMYLRSNSSSAISVPTFQYQRGVVAVASETIDQRVFAFEILRRSREAQIRISPGVSGRGREGLLRER